MNEMLDAQPPPLGRLASRQALALDARHGARLEALSTQDGRIFTWAVCAHLTLWTLGIAAITMLAPWHWLQAVIGLVLGSQLHAITVLQHDCGHQSAYRSKAANLWIGRALACFIYLPFTTFTELHRMHHAHLGDPERDPDNWFFVSGNTWQLFLRECLFLPRFIYLSLVWPMSAIARRRVWCELCVNTIVYVVLSGALIRAHRLDILVFGFALPMLALACLYNPISRGYEHLPMSTFAPDDPRRFDIRFNTITVTSRMIGLLWANINYHVEHHLYPRVPFHRLRQLHTLLADRDFLRRPYPLAALRDL